MSGPDAAAASAGRPDPGSLRLRLGDFATGVTVVTVGGACPHGMTANSFTSVSLDPPLVLVCVARQATMHRLLGTARVFGVSVLAAGQERLARHFADGRRGPGHAQFADVPWDPGPCSGVPLLAGSLSRFECAVRDRHDAGDHTIVLGEVLSASRCGEATRAGLLFFRGTLGPTPCPVPARSA